MQPNSEITAATENTTRHWSEQVADSVLGTFPNLDLYTCAAGISPSGIVHFGNFRDVITSVLVARAIQSRGLKTRVIFSWDDYDRFRKVPEGVSKDFVVHIGKPLSAVPDPKGKFESYARRFEDEFERAMQELSIELHYRYQTKEYKSGRYQSMIVHCLRRRTEIADILLSFMSEKGIKDKQIDPVEYREKYFPLSVYSRFSGKDNTKVLAYDGEWRITYYCADTKQEDIIDIREHPIVKLPWKVDWPMRWAEEGVVFEPGGRDHATPGGSYDVGTVISPKIFNRPAPAFVGYEFIGLQDAGTKMSGSKGNAISPAQLLEIYEPELLKWLYARKSPEQGFNLAFDTEILRQYDEFDREVEDYKLKKLTNSRARAIELSFEPVPSTGSKAAVPFKQAVALGQTVQWSTDRVCELLNGLAIDFEPKSVPVRLNKARAWLETYNPDQVLRLLPEPAHAFIAQLNETQRTQIRRLREELVKGMSSVQELETMVYSIPKDPTLSQKENATRQRAFFRDVYLLLLGKESGPRLSTFLWAVDRAHVLRLLESA